MDLLDFKIGNLLRLDIFGENGKIIDRDFVSQFEAPINAYEALIAVPIVEGMVYAVRVGWSIIVYMQDGNSFYRFQARVAQRLEIDGRQLLRILRVSAIDEAQRRKYFRFKHEIPFKYRVVNDYRKDLDTPYIDCRTADISGSGLSFTSAVELLKGSFLECELEFGGTPIYLIGKIMRCVRLFEEDMNHFEFQIGVLFSEIEEYKREFIIKFIFHEERRQLQTKA